MRVIGLSGSPVRGGNTETALRAVLEGASGAGAESELVRLYEMDIAPCDGCDSCLAGRGCVIGDQGNALFERLERADAIVFASPVYWYTVSGPMKDLVDRSYYAAHHKELAGKRIGVILVQHSEGGRETLPLFDCWMREQQCTMLEPVIVDTAGKPGVVAGDAGLLQRLRGLGARLAGCTE